MTAIAVAVVSYNTRDHLRRCLASVRAARPVETVVADNGSTDGTLDMVRRDFPEMRLQVHAENPGYGEASNRAIRATSAPAVLLLNSDTELDPGALPALAAYLDSAPKAGIVGPRLRNPDGTLQPSSYPFPGSLGWLLDNDSLQPIVRRVPALRALGLRTYAHDAARTVPFVKGAALLIRRTAFESVRGFDPGYFMYAEEVDLCWRMTQAGWEIHFAPVTDVVHVGGVSTAQHRTAMRVAHYASDLRFYRRHYGPVRLGALVALHKAHAAVRLARDGARLLLTRPADTRVREDVLAWKRMLLGR